MANDMMFSGLTESILPPANSDNRYFNRELSWLAFNERVLALAEDVSLPLAERLRFVSISADNLHEFFMVRIAGLRQLQQRGVHRVPVDDTEIDTLLSLLHQRSSALLAKQNRLLASLIAAFKAENILILDEVPTDGEDMEWLETHFVTNILPLLTPTTLDPAHPFPFFHNQGKGMLFELADTNKKLVHGVILLPENLGRFVKLPGDNLRFVLVEAVIKACIGKIYTKHVLKSSSVFSIIRDSEIEIDDEANDLINEFETALRARKRGSVVLLTLTSDASASTLNLLCQAMAIEKDRCFGADGPVSLNNFAELISYMPKHLLYPTFNPRFPQRIRDFDGDCFAAIRNKDIVVHHPYESFEVVVRFLQQAARDPDVLAIRQTLYRTTPNSPIVRTLIEAAESGKSVTAVIELKARFDEKNNILLARDLERAGVHIAYGLTDLKIHAKMSAVVRRESGRLVTYTHLGTGNYHPITAKVYTDLSYFTCDKDVGRDVYEVFKYLTSHVHPEKLKKSFISPYQSMPRLSSLIDAEIAAAGEGKPSGIWMKCNAIVDRNLIDKLYEASCAGVRIEIIARGICCLRPGIDGLSENITVRSIVGRYLEHGRVYAFANGGRFGSSKNTVFMSSADLMPRNLLRRVEMFVQLENPTVRKQVINQILTALLQDERNSWFLMPDGSYRHPETGPDSFSAHDYFIANPSLSGAGSLAKETK
jgi:polyphosphate kinase